MVHVTDVNEPPQFLRSHYGVTVSEGAESGDLLYSDINALDRDEVLITTVSDSNFTSVLLSLTGFKLRLDLFHSQYIRTDYS